MSAYAVNWVMVQRELARVSQCRGRLTQLAWAIRGYHEEFGVFPPVAIRDQTGRPVHSWRVLILPYFGSEMEELFGRYHFDEPWNSKHNARLAPEIQLDRLRCPSDFSAAPSEVSYLALTDENGAWQLDRTGNERSNAGTCKFVIVEMRNSGIHWMEPRDVKCPESGAKGLIENSPHLTSIHVIAADGAVESLDADGNRAYHGPTRYFD